VNLDFVPWQSVGCVTFFDYYTKLIVITMTPVGVLVALLLFFLLPSYYFDTTDMSDNANFRANRKRSRRQFWKLVLFTLFLMYPGVSSTVLSFYVCKDIEGTKYLLKDFSLRCYDHRWFKYLPYDVFMILLYPIGIPAVFFGFIYRYKRVRRLVEPGIRLQLGFLYEAYNDDMWWFEMADMMHKLAMTSLIAFFPLDAQMPLGLVVLTLYAMVILLGKPYIRKGDDRLHLFAQTELYLIVLCAYILTAYDSLDNTTDVLLSVLLILITCFIILLAIYMVVMNAKKILRNYQAQKINKMEQRLADEEDFDHKEQDRTTNGQELTALASPSKSRKTSRTDSEVQ